MGRRHFKLLIALALFCTPLACTETEYDVAKRLDAEEMAYNQYIGPLLQMRSTFAEAMEKEFGLNCSGHQGTTYETIEDLGMSFQANRRASINEARALALLVMDRFVDAINADKNIRAFLKTYPFTSKNISIGICFEGVNGRYADGSVSRIFSVSELATPPNQNHLFYYRSDPFTCDSTNFLTESLSEALKKNETSHVKNPALHKTTEREKHLDAFFLSFRKKMAKEHGLECWAIDATPTQETSNENADKISYTIGAKFVALQSATKKQARELLMNITQSMLQAINDDLNAETHLSTLPINQLKLRLCFKKKRTYLTYKNGTMESIVLDRGQITYFREMPEKERAKLGYVPEIQTYATESYKDAIKLTTD